MPARQSGVSCAALWITQHFIGLLYAVKSLRIAGFFIWMQLLRE
jgi:hypothetical protein